MQVLMAPCAIQSLRYPVLALSSPCTVHSSFVRAMAMITSCSKIHELPVSQSVWWTFDVDHVTMAEMHIAVLTIVRNYCSESFTSNIGSIIPPFRGISNIFNVLKTPPGSLTKCQPHTIKSDGDMREHTYALNLYTLKQLLKQCSISLMCLVTLDYITMLQLARRGLNVVLVSRSAEKLADTAAEIGMCESHEYLNKDHPKQMASGQGSHWLVESPTFVNLCVTCPPEICVNFVFKHIHATNIYSRYDLVQLIIGLLCNSICIIV